MITESDSSRVMIWSEALTFNSASDVSDGGINWKELATLLMRMASHWYLRGILRRMITGVHAMIYSPEAEALRAFFRDKLGMEHMDAGEGWLIFTPEFGEIGFHPDTGSKHELSLVCDDIEDTVRQLAGRGVEFTCPIEDHGYGLITYIRAPGGQEIQLFQKKY